MRTVYREQMDNLAHGLIVMCDHVHGMHRAATKALFEADLQADNPGAWMLHCHNIYHAEIGMMTSLQY